MNAPPNSHPTDKDLSAGTPNFNRLARLYRWLEYLSFGPLLWRCRIAFLGELATCRRALVLGDGDGRFTARLLQTNPIVEVDAIDASPAMLHSLLRRAGPHASRVHTFCIDARQFQPPNPTPEPLYDLIVTHFFLDCLTTEEVQSLAAIVRKTASPQAQWLVSEFAIPTTTFGRLIARPLVRFLYFVFGHLTGLALRKLPDHGTALRHSGFALQKQRTWLAGLLVSELWSQSQAVQHSNPCNSS